MNAIHKHSAIFPDGWYINPPRGVAVLTGTSTQDSRINYDNLRLERVWPRSDIFLGEKNEMLYVYFSPVDRKTGMIGDFAMTIYIGQDQHVIDHIKRCLAINREIFNHVKVGMQFSEIYEFAEDRFKTYGLTNTITSVTDPAKINIGHTVPASYEDWTPDEIVLLKQGEKRWNDVLTMISKKRIFINSVEKQPIQAGMAITIEPRLTHQHSRNIPMSSYHTIIIINPDGTKELLTNFEDIFKITGMEYML